MSQTQGGGQKSASKVKTLKVQITEPVAGKFKLPYNVGQVVDIPEEKAKELIESKHAVKA